MKTCRVCGVAKAEDLFTHGRGGIRTNRCRVCTALYMGEYRRKNKDKWKTWAEINSNPKSAHSARMAQIRYKFKMGEQELSDMMDDQQGLCLICRDSLTDPSRNKLDQYNIDHNHDTGEVRGLLCSKCNTGIGYLKDSSDVCMRAATYLMAKGEYSGT